MGKSLVNSCLTCRHSRPLWQQGIVRCELATSKFSSQIRGRQDTCSAHDESALLDKVERAYERDARS